MVLFRGKRIDNGKFEHGDYLYDSIYSTHCIRVHGDIDPCVSEPAGASFHEDIEVDSKTVSQYIGIKDKNDTKMFSGDKFRVHSKNNENWHIDKIVRVSPNSLTLEVANIDELKNEDLGQIWQRPQEYWWKDRIGRIEIIGNIYE